MVRVWWTRRGFQIALLGIVLATAGFLRQTQGAFISEIYYWLARPFQGEENLQIQGQLTNARIQELEQRLAELEYQNQQLEKLLGYFESQKQPVIAAPIVGRSADYWWQQVTLGRGSQDGIKENFIVTGIGGLVGRVVSVTPHTSRVLLVSDSTSRVGASISRSRDLGLIKGQGSQTAVMEFFEKVPDVRPGDVVTTSAVSRLFPSGLPIGKVKEIKLKSGPAPEATIELSAPLDYLEWVIVHPFTRK